MDIYYDFWKFEHDIHITLNSELSVKKSLRVIKASEREKQPPFRFKEWHKETPPWRQSLNLFKEGHACLNWAFSVSGIRLIYYGMNE